MHGRTERTPENLAAFLEALANSANVSASCTAAGIARSSAYEWRASDPAFKAAWDEAVELGLDALEDEAIRRGRDGVEKPVYQGGKAVGTVREYSDTLLMFMLNGRRPERFRRNVSAEIAGKNGGPIDVRNLSTDQLVAILATQAVARDDPEHPEGAGAATD
ncbi:MAG: hypothetical protein WDN25_13340 [Acetobacteraceae bacterium]